MIFSFAGTGISHVVLATYIYLSANTTVNLDDFQWVPVTSFSAMIFIASCGALPVPYVIVSEILPNKVSWTHFESHKLFFCSTFIRPFSHIHMFFCCFHFPLLLLTFNLVFIRFEASEQHSSYAFHGVSPLSWSKYFPRALLSSVYTVVFISLRFAALLLSSIYWCLCPRPKAKA